jgi:hypothetical protein
MEKSSRVFAANLRKLAEWLDSKPEFPVTNEKASNWYMNFHEDKESFLQAVRAIGAGRKEDGQLGKSELRFVATTPTGTEFAVEVYRSSLCRLVRPAQEAVYECEPLLSQAEMEEV